MDDILVLIVLVLLALILLPIISLVRTSRLRRRAATKDEIAFLTQRIYTLEQSFEKLRKSMEGTPARGEPAKPDLPSVAPPAKPAAEPARIPPVTPGPTPLPGIAPPPKPGIEPKPVTADFVAAAETKAAPQFKSTAAAPKRDWKNFEEKLGTNWLNKIGVAVLILGGAFLANYAMQTLGPAGKAAMLYVLAAALLGLGIFGEKKEKYRVGARGVLGGGWALAYFTTYAIHNVEAVQLIKSPTIGFGLLFVVAAAMVWHSLRYDSQVVTGFAYLLAFASVAVSRITVGTLVSSAVLAASLVIVLARRKWYVLEIPAIAATYGVHWYWLWRTYEYIGGHKKFPDFPASVALLGAYWAIFTISHFLRDDKEPAQRMTLTGAFLLNVAGFLAVMRYQSFYPQWRFWFLLGVGVLYVALALFSRRMGRRLGFVLTSTMAATLLFVAVPNHPKLAGSRLELIWLAEAEALLIIGWRALDTHLRRLGWVALGVLGTWVSFNDLSPRLVDWAPPDWAAGWLFLTLAAAFYINAHYAPRLLGKEATESELAAATVSYGVGTGFVLCAAWFALPFMWTALAWTAVGLVVCEAGRRLNENALRVCGHGTALLAAVRLLVINLEYAPAIQGISLRVVTVALAAALFYAGGRRIAGQQEPFEAKPETIFGGVDFAKFLPGEYTWFGTSLLALLVWNEVTNAAVGLAWALLGLALVEVGRTVLDRPLVAQGHTLLILSFARIFFADLNAERAIGMFSARLVTVTLLAAFYYYAGYTAEERTPRMRTALMWMGTVALVAMLRFELVGEWVAVGWAALVVALYFGGRAWNLRMLNRQAYVVTLLTGVRCAFDNFYQTGPMWFTNARTVTVTVAALLMYALLGMSLVARSRTKPEAAPELANSKWRVIRWTQKTFRWLDANPQQIYFFVPTILLTVLISLELAQRGHGGYLTASWGLEAFIIFVVALNLREKSYRWFSLGLLLLCIGRAVAIDVWRIESPLGRIVSLMGLGAASLLVSFLYTKNKELFRKYL